jgi:hypothetical protein
MPTNYADIAAKHGGVPDPDLTAETQLSLERSPYALRKWLDIPEVKAYKATAPPNAEESAGGVPPIAGVKVGDTKDIQVYRPRAYVTDPNGVPSNQFPVHESDHLVQNEMKRNFPAWDAKNPYKDLKLDATALLNLRKGGDTLWKHSKEGQASILQTYQARQDWLNNVATPEQKRDYLASTGQFAGNGNAEFMQAYGPYLDDLENAKMPKGAYNASVQQTAMKPPALLLPSTK